MTFPDNCDAMSGGVRIAYQVVGNGPIDLVFVPGSISNLDLNWEDLRLQPVVAAAEHIQPGSPIRQAWDRSQ